MSRSATLSVLFLAGCGGLTPLNPFGDTGAIVDTALDTDTGFDTGDTDIDTTATFTPPRLMSMSAVSVGGDIEVSFQVEDDDDDLVGGDFEITVNGGTTGYAIPYDLSTWSTTTGTGTLRLPTPGGGSGSTGCTGGGGGGTVSMVGRVVDSHGLRSGTKTATLSVGGGVGTITLSEVGDTLESVDPVGDVVPPCNLVGDMHSTGGGAGYGDIDILELAVPAPMTVSLSLSWATAADYDLIVYDSVGYLFLTLFDTDLPLAVSNAEGPVQETVNLQMDPAELYYVVVAGWDGPGGAYTLSLQ